MSQNKMEKIIPILLWIIIGGLGIYIFIKCFFIIKTEYGEDKTTIVQSFFTSTQEKAIETYLPGLVYEKEEETEETPAQWLLGKVMEQLPFFHYMKSEEDYDLAVESDSTYEKIVAENSGFLETKILEENQEAGPADAGEEDATDAEDTQKNQEVTSSDDENAVAADSAAGSQITDIPLEKFQDYDFVISNFFTIDKTTTLSSEQLNAPTLVSKDMRMTTGNDQPQILIYHTHSQEDFRDSTDGDASTTVVGVGEHLATILRETYGYNVIHVTNEFDVVNGKIDRNKAYSYARDYIQQVLSENPSVEVLIDLHRDGVAEEKRLMTTINDKPTAQIMFFNGLSRTTKNGDIDYLANPYIEDNLAFSLQLKLAALQYYPDFTRTIYLKAYRYNLDLLPKSLLVECGAQNSTVEEEMNAMEPLADILNKVLKGE